MAARKSFVFDLAGSADEFANTMGVEPVVGQSVPDQAEGLSRETLSVTIYNSLRLKLLMGAYEPGERLDIRGLASAFNTSPTPVREAVMQLVREGGLELRPGRELRVAVATLKRYAQVCTVRAPLERLAVELATPLISEATLMLLEEINQAFFEAEKRKDVKRAISLNSRFHLTIYGASENDLLVRTIENLWMLTVPLLNKQYPLTAHRHDADHPHSQLIAALRRRDAARAAQLVVEDLRKGSGLILKKLKGDELYDDGAEVLGPYLG